MWHQTKGRLDLLVVVNGNNSQIGTRRQIDEPLEKVHICSAIIPSIYGGVGKHSHGLSCLGKCHREGRICSGRKRHNTCRWQKAILSILVCVASYRSNSDATRIAKRKHCPVDRKSTRLNSSH